MADEYRVDGIAHTLENLSESDEHLRWVMEQHAPPDGKSFCPVCDLRAPCDMVSLAASGLARSTERDEMHRRLVVMDHDRAGLAGDLDAATARADALALANAETRSVMFGMLTPMMDGSERQRAKDLLAQPSDARGAELLAALRSIAEEDLSDPDYLGDVANRVVRNARRALAGGGNGE